MTATTAKVSDTREVYTRLGSVEKHNAQIESRLGAVEHTLIGHGDKLDRIVQAVSGHRSFDPLYILKFIAMAAAIVSAAAAAITYVSANINAPQLAVLEYRMGLVESGGHWTARTESVR
jgi:hypothetical protein